MSLPFSYRHLYYFWVVGQEGGIARAAARLGMAVQTVSAQVHALERSLGCVLLRPAGRKLVPTEAGAAALRQAEQIFALGAQLPALVREAAGAPQARLAVGVSDGVAKLVVRRLLAPVLAEPALRLVCHEGEIDDLLADLALHRLDVVITDRAAPPHPNVRVYSHALGGAPLAWYAAPAQAAAARRGFPASLGRVPVLLPTRHAATRPLLDAWFERIGVVPRVAGEFEDSALLATFGAGGLGVFPAVAMVDDELAARFSVRQIGRCEGVEERFFALSAERRLHHPLVQRLVGAHSGR